MISPTFAGKNISLLSEQKSTGSLSQLYSEPNYPDGCLVDFDMEDLEYYFEDFKKKQNFLALYIKNKYIQKRKYELAKDFNK